MRVGKYKILHQLSYLHMAGEDAIVSFDTPGGEANFRIRFIVEEDAEDRAVKRLEAYADPEASDRGLLTFANFHKSQVSSSAEPILVMKMGDEEQPVFMVAVIHYTKHIYAVNLQFMVEGD